MRIDGSIKTLTAGISNLDPKLDGGNHDQVCTNLVCNPQMGLQKRPALHWIASIRQSFNTNFDVVLPFKNNNEQFWVYINSVTIEVYDNEGINYPVDITESTGYFSSIAGPDSVAVAATDTTLFMINKIQPVRKTLEVETRQEHSMIVVLQAPLSFSKIEVTWRDSTGASHTIEHEVPDSFEGDVGTNTTAQAIAVLMDAEAPAADSLHVHGSTILYGRAGTGYADITVADGQRQAGIVAINDETDSVNNLPKYSTPGALVAIRPDSTSTRGQFFMKSYTFLTTSTAALPEVEWKEASAPGERVAIMPASFVHTLSRLPEGDTFYFSPMTGGVIPDLLSLRNRTAGDDETNPFPPFIDKPLSGIAFFQNRLLLLSGETINLSITNAPHAWFRETATQQLDIDPISIKSSQTDAQQLNWVVPHHNDLLLFSETAQYKLDGSIGITSRNAAVKQSSSYINSPITTPVPHGSDVLFATKHSAAFAGLSKYTVDRAAESQDIAYQLSLHIQRALLGDIRQIVESTSTNMILCTITGRRNAIYVNHSSQSKVPQNSWSYWELPNDCSIQSMLLEGSAITLAVTTTGSQEGNTNLQLYNMQINELSVLSANHPGSLIPPFFVDYRRAYPDTGTLIILGGAYPIIDLTPETFVIMQGFGCPNPGEVILDWSYEPGSLLIVLGEDMNQGEVWCGYRFMSDYMPSRRWIRDDSGVAQSASQFRITDYNFFSEGSDIQVSIENAPEEWPIQTFNSDLGENIEHRVSFKQRHDEADIRFRHNGHDYFNLTQVEWRGTYIKVGRRF